MTRARSGAVIIKTSDISLDVMLRGQLRYLRENGVSPLTVVAADTGRLAGIAAREGVSVKAVPLRRDPSPLHDVLGLARLVYLLVALRPRLVVYGTPKASLLGALAAWLTRVPVRIHILHGLRLDTAAGALRRLLLHIEGLVIRLSTESIAVGHGLVEQCAELGLDTRTMTVLGSGSIGGVDVDHYSPRSDSRSRQALRRAYGIRSTIVVGFVGRLTPDKGLDALVQAIAALRDDGTDIGLVLVGPDEGLSELSHETRRLVGADWVTLIGELEDPAEAYSVFDVFCLPSRREGLGTVVLEAWAAEVPVVVSDIPALRALVADRETGRIARLDDPRDLGRAIVDAHADRRGLTARARDLVRSEFDYRIVWARYRDVYLRGL